MNIGVQKYPLPRNHIKNFTEFRKYQCLICLDSKTDIMQCSGPCKSFICLRCATNMGFDKQSSYCPQRCSNPLALQKIPNFKIQFNCPFNPIKCIKNIMSVDHFYDHCNQCQFMNPSVAQQNLRQMQYVCSSGHPLSYYDQRAHQQIYPLENYFKIVIKDQCFNCKQYAACMSICTTCSNEHEKVIFCNICRKLPCTKQMCPIGHEIKRCQQINPRSYCNICGFKVIIFNNISYTDSECNLDICGDCYNKLPQFHHLVPLQHKFKQKQKVNIAPNLLHLFEYGNNESSNQENDQNSELNDDNEDQEDINRQSDDEQPQPYNMDSFQDEQNDEQQNLEEQHDSMQDQHFDSSDLE